MSTAIDTMSGVTDIAEASGRLHLVRHAPDDTVVDLTVTGPDGAEVTVYLDRDLLVQLMIRCGALAHTM